MKEEDLVRAAVKYKAYFDLGSLNEENLLIVADLIHNLKEKQEAGE